MVSGSREAVLPWSDRMKRLEILFPFFATLFSFFWCATAGFSEVSADRSPCKVLMDARGKSLYVLEHSSRSLAVLDLRSEKVSKRIELPERPTDMTMCSMTETLYVTTDSCEGEVLVLDLKKGRITRRLRVGHTPMAPVLSQDGKRLYVCNRFNNDVSVLSLDQGQEIARIPVLREPTAAVLAGKELLFVANLLPEGPSNLDVVAAAVSVIDTNRNEALETLRMVNGSIVLRGICASPDRRFVYVTHGLARFHLPTTQLERGWMNTNALSVIDAESVQLVNTVLLDDVDLGAANPWGIACTEDGQWLCASLAGAHEICVIDRRALHEKLDRVAGGEAVSEVSRTSLDVPNDLAFLVGLKRRLGLKGNGPRGIAVFQGKAYAAEYFADSIGVVDLDPGVYHRPRSIALGSDMELSEVRKGEMYFNDAQLCFQRWQSCASCHPDARADGLNWDLLNDGMGNPKNTKSMLWAHRTPPAMITGVRDSAEVAVRSGIRFIQFAVRPEEDARAIDAYLSSLEPVPSPFLVQGELSPAAQRGKRIFERADCASCHAPPLFTDLSSYDVGTGTEREQGQAFDTPTIVENWRTAPYLYDGRAATMMEVLTTFNQGDRHGRTSDLSEEELSDLVEYILSQ